MRRNRQEWDWPPRRRPSRYSVLDATPIEGGWSSPTTTAAVSIYWRVVKFTVKMVLGAILGAFLIGCVWLFATIAKS